VLKFISRNVMMLISQDGRPRSRSHPFVIHQSATQVTQRGEMLLLTHLAIDMVGQHRDGGDLGWCGDVYLLYPVSTPIATRTFRIGTRALVDLYS
jgi:hypothetical protein